MCLYRDVAYIAQLAALMLLASSTSTLHMLSNDMQRGSGSGTYVRIMRLVAVLAAMLNMQIAESHQHHIEHANPGLQLSARHHQ